MKFLNTYPGTSIIAAAIIFLTAMAVFSPAQAASPAYEVPQNVFYKFTPAQMKALPYITQQRIAAAAKTSQDIIDGGPRYTSEAAYQENEKYKRAVGACQPSDVACHDKAYGSYWKTISKMAREIGLPIEDTFAGNGSQVCHGSPNKTMFDLCYKTELNNQEKLFTDSAGKLTDKERRSQKVMEILETPLTADQVCFDNQLCRYDQYAKANAQLEKYLKNRR